MPGGRGPFKTAVPATSSKGVSKSEAKRKKRVDGAAPQQAELSGGSDIAGQGTGGVSPMKTEAAEPKGKETAREEEVAIPSEEKKLSKSKDLSSGDERTGSDTTPGTAAGPSSEEGIVTNQPGQPGSGKKEVGETTIDTEKLSKLKDEAKILLSKYSDAARYVREDVIEELAMRYGLKGIALRKFVKETARQ